MNEGELFQEFRTFYAAFKDDFIKSTVTFILLCIGYIIVTINFIYSKYIGELGWYLTVLQIPVLLQLVLIHSHVFIIEDLFDMSVLKSIKVAWILGNRNIVKVIGVMGIGYLLLKVSLLIPIILLFLLFSIVSILQYYFYYESIANLVKKEET
jgi:uncharacterized membrane protein YesL